MPKSRNRKNHKKKVEARRKRMDAKKRSMESQFRKMVEKRMSELNNNKGGENKEENV